MSQENATRKKMLGSFRDIGRERLERLNRLVLRLEAADSDEQLAPDIKREIHTLKGEARLVGLPATQKVAHRTEDLIHLACQQKPPPKAVIDAILRGLDFLSQLIDGLSQDGEPSDAGPEVESFSTAVDAVLGLETQSGHETAPAPTSAPAVGSLITRSPADGGYMAEESGSGGPQPRRRSSDTDGSVRVALPKLERLTRFAGELRTGHAAHERLIGLLQELGGNLTSASQRVSNSRQWARAARHQGRSVEGLLDEVLEELMASQKQAQQTLRNALALAQENTFENRGRLDRLTDAVRELRMLPLDSLFGIFPRAIRDLAADLDKKARLQVAGGAIEVDKRVLDDLREPLLHLLRNSVDHGLEGPAERKKARKDPTGTLFLRAELQQARVRISLSDDGRGIDPEALRRQAVKLRLLSEEAAATASERAIMNLLFAPAFTTTSEVTDLSGRGIGLDVVRRRIEGLGGTVAVSSVIGNGTTFELEVPVSVTMARALIVRCADGLYAFASELVDRAAMVKNDQLEWVGTNAVYRDGEVQVPLSELGVILGTRRNGQPEGEEKPVVILRHGGAVHGFWVDEIVREEEVIQKAPGAFLEGSSLIQGSGVLGHGEVAIFPSLSVLFEAARLAAWRGPVGRPTASPREQKRILVVEDSELTRDLVVGLLREEGYEVTEAVDGRDGLDKIARALPDLIITDLQMPVLDGFGFLKELRASPDWRGLPVVVLTTLASEADRRQAALFGADAYLLKSSIQRQEVVATIDRFLGA